VLGALQSRITYHFQEAGAMEITERVENGVTVFELKGRVDTEGAIDVELTLQAAISDGQCKMVLDMAEVRYISSAGLRTLADVLTRNRDAGGDLKLVALTPKVMRVFQIIGFDRFFSFYATVEAAIADF
jgi:anti-anti-sigma factor